MKEKKPFEPGEKIRFVGGVQGVENFLALTPYPATVNSYTQGQDKVLIDFYASGFDRCEYIHVRQVTHRIRKKPKPAEPKRLEVWLAFCPEGIRPEETRTMPIYGSKDLAKKYYSSPIKVTEVYPGERVVSREDIEKAWEITFRPEVNGLAKNDICFKNFCKALGFPEERT